MIVYKVTNKLNNKIYIGKTKQSLSKRRAAHYKRVCENSPTNFHNALRIHPKDNFIWEIEVNCNTELEMDTAEIHCIQKYNSYTDGYNMTFGGDGGVTYKKGDILYERIKHKLGKWKDGNPGATSEAIAKRMDTFKHTQWISGSKHGNYGHSHTKGILIGSKNPMAKSILIDDIEYETISSASNILSISPSTIGYRCNSEKFKNYKFKI